MQVLPSSSDMQICCGRASGAVIERCRKRGFYLLLMFTLILCTFVTLGCSSRKQGTVARLQQLHGHQLDVYLYASPEGWAARIQTLSPGEIHDLREALFEIAQGDSSQRRGALFALVHPGLGTETSALTARLVSAISSYNDSTPDNQEELSLIKVQGGYFLSTRIIRS